MPKKPIKMNDVRSAQTGRRIGVKPRATEAGFVFGPAKVECISANPNGSVYLRVKTARADLEVTVTPTGLLRMVHNERRVGPLLD